MGRFGLGDFQFLVKAACSIIILICVLFQLILKGSIGSLRRLWFPILYLLSCFTSLLWSINFQESLISLIGIFIIFSSFIFLNNSCDKIQIIEAVFYTCLFYLVLNAILYPFFEENFYDYLQGKYRFSGVTYGAHSIARIALFLVLAALSLMKYGKISKKKFMLVVMFSAPFFALSDSRQVYICIFVLMLIYILFREHKSKLENINILCFGFVIFGAYYVFFFSDVGSFSRSGNIDEITTLTGRISIWQTALELIAQKPYFGYGFGSAQWLLENNYSTQFGWTTGSAHNSFLHMALEMGLILTALFHIHIVLLLIRSLREKNFFNLGIILVLIIIGALEKSYSGNAGFLFLFMLLASANLKNESTPYTLPIKT